MRQVTRKGLITVAAAGGVLAAFSGGTAFADTGVQGSAANTGGVLSGNNVQAPINAPIDVCGNTVNVVGALNPASGVSCNDSGSTPSTSGSAQNSPGIGSGNNVEAPINAPIDVCGNSINVIGIGNGASGSECDDSGTTPPGGEVETPGTENPGSSNPGSQPPSSEGSENGPDGPPEIKPASDVRTQSTPATGELAHTGAGEMVGIGAPLSAGLLIGGFVLYRRASRLAQR